MSSTRTHFDGSSGDEDKLALRIALERSWVNTGGSSGEEDELALCIALKHSWVNTGGTPGPVRRHLSPVIAGEGPAHLDPIKKPLEPTLTHFTLLQSPFPNPFNP